MKKWLLLIVIGCASLSASLFSATERLTSLLSDDMIKARTHTVAKRLNREYAGKQVAIVAVMKGAICITADIMRELTCQHTLDWITASSYGLRGSTPGELTVTGLEQLNLKGRDVLLIDDIFDTGNTLSTLVKKIREKKPRSVKTLVLLQKKIKRHISYRPDYALFYVDNHFLVGYGLDYKERYRGLPGVYALHLDTK